MNRPLINVLFADGFVGIEVLRFIFETAQDTVGAVVVTSEDSPICSFLDQNRFPSDAVLIYDKIHPEHTATRLSERGYQDYFFLVWWPYIVRNDLIRIPRRGVINCHPSYLPFDRGKHYNFWTIVDNSPFGVSLHFVNEKVDEGDIIFQQRIEKTWEDTGASLYFRAQRSMIELFERSYPSILTGEYVARPQDLSIGTFHKAIEIDEKSQIDLDKMYIARDLLNLLRARTFPPHPGCFFRDEGRTYEIRIEIKEKNE